MSYAAFLADAAAVRNYGEWWLELYLTDPNGAAETLRYSRHGTPSPGAAVTVGSDTIAANTPFAKRLLTIPTMKQSLWAQGRIGGRSLPAFGNATLNNADGGLDDFRPVNGYKWADRRAKLFFFDLRDPQDTIGKVFDGKLGQPRFGRDVVDVALRGREAQFAQPVSSRVYRGGSYMLELSGARTIAYGTPSAVKVRTSLTVEGWLWINADTATSARNWGWYVGTATPWALNLNTDRTLAIRAFVGGVAEGPTTTAVLALQTMYHVACVVSGTAATFYIWNDDAQTLTTETFPTAFSNATRDDGTGADYRMETTSTRVLWWDECRVWNVARTLAEIEAFRFSYFPAGAVPSSLVHYPRMEDGSGTTVTDASATAANGTISGAGSSTWLPSMEGGDALAGSPKPDAWGRVFGAEPALVEPLGVGGTGPSYQFAGGGPVEELTTISEGAATISQNANAASFRAFLVASPAAGTVTPYLARGLFKLGSQPTLPIRVTGKGYDGGALGYVETAADIIRDIVTRRGPKLVDPTDLDTTSFSDFEGANASPVGVFIPAPNAMSIDAVLDFIAGSIGGWWGYVRGATTLHVERFDGPTGKGIDISFDQTDLKLRSLQEIPWTPVYEVIVRYRPSRPLTEDQVAAAVKGTAGWANWTKDWLEERATDSTLRADFPGDASRQVIVETGLYRQQDARAEADRLLSVLGGDGREGWAAVVRSTGREVTLADVASLQFVTQAGVTRLGLDGTKEFAVLTIEDTQQRGETRVEAWG